MERRNFLKLMVGGIAAGAAVRTFPFRVFSFPKNITIDRGDMRQLFILGHCLNVGEVVGIYTVNGGLASEHVIITDIDRSRNIVWTKPAPKIQFAALPKANRPQPLGTFHGLQRIPSH